MTFTTIKLAKDRVLVKGTDQFGAENSTILDGSEWFAIKALKADDKNHEAFDEAVLEFFAPLTAAADKLEASHKPVMDPLSFVVLQEGEPSIEGQTEVLHHLSHDSIVLRLIEQDEDSDRLVWVHDVLEVLAPKDEPIQDPFTETVDAV